MIESPAVGHANGEIEQRETSAHKVHNEDVKKEERKGQKDKFDTSSCASTNVCVCERER